MPTRNNVQEAVKLFGRQMRWRAAADEERLDFARLAEPTQLALERCKVGLDQSVAPGDECEVAVPAAVSAKRNVNVGRTRSHEICKSANNHAQRCNRPSNMSGTFFMIMRRMRSGE